MKYTELFQKYKDGTASAEEKLLVEQELDRATALEDYLSESMDDLLHEPTSPSEKLKQETSHVTKTVNRRLRRVVLTSVAVVAGLYLLIFYGLSGLMNALYYNPTSTDLTENMVYKPIDITFDMDALIGMNYPGKSIGMLGVEPKGFAKYNLQYYVQDLFRQQTIMERITIKRGRRFFSQSDSEGLYSTFNMFESWSGFSPIQFPSQNTDPPEEQQKVTDVYNNHVISILEELNPLSYVSLSLTFPEDLTIFEVYQLREKNKPLDFRWVGVRTVEPGEFWRDGRRNHLIGFNPMDDSNHYPSKPSPEKYPLFYLADIVNYPEYTQKELVEGNAEAAEIHFLSRLNYLIDRQEFVKIFDYNSTKTDFYRDALAYVTEHGVMSYGSLIFGTAKDLVEALEQIPYASLYINQVSPTKPHRLLNAIN